MKVFEKKLWPSERARHWIIVPTADRENFPPNKEPFEIKVGSETVKVRIDSNNRILGLGWSVFDKLGLGNPGAIVVIDKTSQEGYILQKK
jgi:hypothetical protein